MPAKKKSKAETKPPSTAPVGKENSQQDEIAASSIKEPEATPKIQLDQDVSKNIIIDAQNGSDTPQPSSSWYGTWSKKSRESLRPESPVTKPPSEAGPSRDAKKDSLGKEAASPQITPAKRKPLLSPGSSARALPLVATITKLNISSEASKTAQSSTQASKDSLQDAPVVKKDEPETSTQPEPQSTDPTTKAIPDEEAPKAEAPAGAAVPTSWLSWGRGDKPFLPGILPAMSTTTETAKVEATAATNTAPSVPQVAAAQPSEALDMATTDGKSTEVPPAWYSRWAFGASNVQVPEASQVPSPPETSVSAPTQADPPVIEPVQNSLKPETSSRSAWAFWSNATSQENNSTGQLAVADSSTQSKPEAAVIQDGSPVLTSEERKKRPLSQGEVPVKKKQTPSTPDPVKKVEEKTAAERPNLLLPTFESTYSGQLPASSIWQQIGSWIYSTDAPKHPVLIKEPRKIKHALAIGVHGYFPGAIVQTVIGKPTGTSIKFADEAAKAIEGFTKRHGYAPQSIDKIALEGEGRIDERLETLWKLLLNWIDMIRKADFILVACHSQGVPVAISLVAKLIGFGCVSEAKIAICAMAGISRGPFAEYKSRWIGGSAAELFEFSDPQSAVSRAYISSLETVLRFGVKIVFVGSLDDQLVPLHSSTFTQVEHPNIYRAVFVDGRIHVADFISHLVGFALKLRNLGVPDHGLIRELSSPLAGSLVGGEGHSRIYHDPAVYDLAMDFSLRTSDIVGKFASDDTALPVTANPFILPFAMRGLLEEEMVRQELSNEVIVLLKQFDHWKPATKMLRDVKYRLEGVRSKL